MVHQSLLAVRRISSSSCTWLGKLPDGAMRLGGIGLNIGEVGLCACGGLLLRVRGLIFLVFGSVAVITVPILSVSNIGRLRCRPLVD